MFLSIGCSVDAVLNSQPNKIIGTNPISSLLPTMVDRSSTRRQTPNVMGYFSALIILFGCLSLGLNLHIAREINLGNVQQYLLDSFTESIQANLESLSQIGGGGGRYIEESWEKSDVKGHSLSGLNCDAYGGPSEEAASEMIYWRDIPSDSAYVSPFKRKTGPTQYLTFEPDQGGWNNIRMSMETVLAMAFAMGR
jgi:hypothetical protein